MIVTKGDAVSETVDRHRLGLIVDYEDEAGVADAILALLEHPRSAWHERFMAAQAEMTWEKAARPLIEFCRTPYRAADQDRELGSAGEEKADASRFRQDLAERDAEIARLQELVAGYEHGHFIKLMRQLHQWRKRLGG
jgi:hypothetical protein